MKTFKTLTISAVVVLALALGLTVQAAAPTLSLVSVSDGDSVQLSVTGSANANVIFYYMKVGAGLQMNYLGKTDLSGNFSTNLSTAAYGLTGSAGVYVTVDNQKSNEVGWPYQAAASVLSLSQTSVVLPLGQSLELTAYNNGTNYIYLSSNSNPPVVNVNINGNKIILKAFNFGSTVVNVCAGASSPSCAGVYVTVQNTGGQALAFSQNNPTVAAGQNVAVTVIGGTGAYTLLNNTNANSIQASLSGSTVALSTTGSSGSSAVTVCSSDMSSCGIINAVVGNASSTGLAFSLTNPTMNIGQNLSITISGGAGGNYSIFSNSNSNAVSAGISGNALSLIANNGGAATITVCSSMGNCAPETVTVNYNTATGGSIAISQNNLWLLAGQAASVTVSGGTLPYSVSGYSENILKAAFNNNILTVTGVGGGSASVNVCSAGGGCKILSVLVTGAGANNNTTVTTPATTVPTVAPAAPATTPAASPAAVIDWTFCANEKQACQFSGYQTVRYGANGKYVYGSYLNSVSCDNATLSDPIENVVKQCSYGGVIPAEGQAAAPAPVKPKVLAEKITVKYKFTKILVYGAKGNDVTELQKKLKAEGFYAGALDGKFLTQTVAAVKKYQKAKGIKQTGNVGVLTMAALNK